MKLKQTLCLALLLAGAVTGCSDPKAATAKNFETAINAMLDKTPGCVWVANGGLPVKVYLTGSNLPYQKEQDAKALKGPEAYVRLGLLKEGKPPYKNGEGLLVKEFELTEAGQKAYRADHGMMGPFNSFCYGTAQVAKMGDITEPTARVDGVTVATAEVDIKFGKPAAWVNDPELQQQLKQRDLHVFKEGDTVHRKITLEKTLDGWVAKPGM
ncbi:hypothetical protein QU487_06350 [Crenobacter sp. SG2305]|uniref:hypothetical protein n=1 Tax=Crenobacter oryzisoli TaxID=3056844 RepID=UPI0025AB04ED|nr:hypothetical protein [Crenobacter sp. SG2305]MDN0082373.1 hypothetical protein [Crenobacter sp. SG2305]